MWGCNELIQSGAGILTSPEDVLDYMGIFHEKSVLTVKKDQKGLAKIEKMVYSCLDSEPRHLEQIMVRDRTFSRTLHERPSGAGIGRICSEDIGAELHENNHISVRILDILRHPPGCVSIL